MQEIDNFLFQGKKWILQQKQQRDMFLEHSCEVEEKEVVENLLDKVENILLNKTQLILNQAFKNICFDSVDDDILRHLVVSRICQPSSKAGTVDYLKNYFDEDVELHRIYRYFDKLHKTQ